MFKQCENEIYSIHEFFEDWLNGKIPLDKNELKRVEQVLSGSFLMISPNGNESGKKELLANLMKAHGNWNGEQIWIKNIRFRFRENNLCLAVYEEWQGNKENESQKGRLSSALFKKEGDDVIRWLHLHEVWI